MITFAAMTALLSCAGCIVTASTYDAKVREVEALSKQVTAEKTAGKALADRLREREESQKRTSGQLDALRKAYEGSRLTWEQFIDELLGKEKATGKRLQELSSQADACAGELAELRKKLETKEAPTARPSAE